jgi:hypothetical protein
MANLFGGTETRRVPRSGKAEECRAARAQEMSPACRAREKRRRKGIIRTALRTAIGEMREMRPRTTARWFQGQQWKDVDGGDGMCRQRAAEGEWARSRTGKGACVQGGCSYSGRRQIKSDRQPDRRRQSHPWATLEAGPGLGDLRPHRCDRASLCEGRTQGPRHRGDEPERFHVH